MKLTFWLISYYLLWLDLLGIKRPYIGLSNKIGFCSVIGEEASWHAFCLKIFIPYISVTVKAVDMPSHQQTPMDHKSVQFEVLRYKGNWHKRANM